MTEPVIRAATDADVEAMVELMRDALGEGRIPRTTEFFRWKHLANPFGRSPILVAEADGRLVGLRAFLRWTFARGSERFRAVRPVDTVTHRDFRGRGIFRKLTETLLEETRGDAPVVFNTPNDKSMPGYLKMGWSTVGRVPLWIAPRIGLASSVLGLGAKGPLELPEGSIDAVVSAPGFETILAEDDGRRVGRLHTARTAEYVRWRYEAIPGFDYRARADGRAAVFFTARDRSGRRELTFVDVLMESSPAGARASRRLIAGVLRDAGCDYAATAAPACPWEAAALASAGFLPAPRVGPWLTSRANGDGAPADLLERSAWACTIGDLELF